MNGNEENKMTQDWAQLKEWIQQLKWKSVDKDNMEFEVRMTCYVRDELIRFASSHGAPVLDSATLEAAAMVAEEFKAYDPSNASGGVRARHHTAIAIATCIRALKPNPSLKPPNPA